MKKISGLSLFLYLFLTIFLPAVHAAETPTLESIDFKAIGTDKEQVTFKLNGTYIPKIFAIKGKNPRVVFDFPQTGIAKTMPNSIKTDGTYIRQIRIGLHTGDNPRTRVVFDLTGEQKIDFNQNFNRETNALTILIFPAKSTAEKATATAGKVKKTAATTAGTPLLKKEVVPVTPTPKPRPTTVSSTPLTSPTTTDHQTITDEKPEKPTQAVTSTTVAAGAKKKQTTAPEKSAIETVNPPVKTGQKIPVLESVSFDNSSNRGEMIQFAVTEFQPPTVFGIEEGLPRVVCDFKNTRAGASLKNIIKANGRYVKTIRIGRHKNPDKIRVVIDLEANNNYDLQQVFFKEENLFVIIVNTMHNASPAEKKTD